jgi:signal transduction histidine kinase
MSTDLQTVYKAAVELAQSTNNSSELYQHIVDKAATLSRSKEVKLCVFLTEPFCEEYSFQDGCIEKTLYSREEIKNLISGELAVHSQKNLILPAGLKHIETPTVLVMPLTQDKELKGCLIMYSTKSTFSTREKTSLLLFRTIANLAISREEASKLASEAKITRDQFITMAAHELRTPLTVINGYVDLLVQRVPAERKPIRKYVDNLSLETQRLTFLVKNLLDVNLINANKLEWHFQEQPIHLLIDSTVRQFKKLYPQRELKVTYQLEQDEVMVVVDGEKIYKVMLGLLDNAAKFSSDASPIRIRIFEEDDYIVISVEDFGIGMDEEVISHALKGFYKAPHNTKDGMGVGLFLAQYIATHHNGSLRVKSQPGKGTTIELRINKSILS